MDNKYVIKNKLRNKSGATHLIEVLIMTPVIIFIALMQISIFQIEQSINYIEDIKTAMTQSMSRDGDLTANEMENEWKKKYEKKQGVILKEYNSIENKVLRSSKQPMQLDLTFDVQPSFLKFIFGGQYKTSAIIYSEYIEES